MIVIDLSKQQARVADPRAIQQINFTANLDQEIQKCFLLLKKQKKVCQTFQKELQNFVNVIKCNFVNFHFYQYKMTQYNSLNIKRLNSQLNKLKSAIKNETEVVLRLSSNMISHDKTNFPHKLLLTSR